MIKMKSYLANGLLIAAVLGVTACSTEWYDGEIPDGYRNADAGLSKMDMDKAAENTTRFAPPVRAPSASGITDGNYAPLDVQAVSTDNVEVFDIDGPQSVPGQPGAPLSIAPQYSPQVIDGNDNVSIYSMDEPVNPVMQAERESRVIPATRAYK